MIKKILYLITLATITMATITMATITMGTLTAEETDFNFRREFIGTARIQDTFEKINAYSNIARQLQAKDSARLTKKFIRMIRSLHQACLEHENDNVKQAYTSLLQTSINNEKLQSMDYTNSLQELLSSYEVSETHVSETPEVLQASVPQAPASSESKEIVECECASKLKDKLSNCCRGDVINLLMLKKLVNQIKRLKDDLQLIKKDVSHISKQDATIKHTFRKLLKIESIVNKNALDGHLLIRSPHFGQRIPAELEEELEEYPQMLREMVLNELDDPSSPFFDTDG